MNITSVKHERLFGSRLLIFSLPLFIFFLLFSVHLFSIVSSSLVSPSLQSLSLSSYLVWFSLSFSLAHFLFAPSFPFLHLLLFAHPPSSFSYSSSILLVRLIISSYPPCLCYNCLPHLPVALIHFSYFWVLSSWMLYKPYIFSCICCE